MQAHDKFFTSVVSEGAKQFIVPVFQRDYRWETDQWERMWSDINGCGSNKLNNEHFLGSLVTIQFGIGTSTFHRWLIIDGQQRLTTLSILLIALRDHIKDIKWKGGVDSPSFAKINNRFLLNQDEEGERRYKLLLRRDDNTELHALIDEEKPDESDGRDLGRIESAYNYYKRMFQLPSTDIDVVWRGVSKLKIVDVTLTDRDNPQLVFESLNSTGVGLSQSDLIRNFILMRLSEEEQTRLYNVYWFKVEAVLKTNDSDLNAFLRDYTALLRKDTKAIKDDQIYNEFKRFAPDLYDDDTLEDHLKDLVQFATYYAKFKGYLTESSKQLVNALRNVRGHSNTPAILIMRLYDYYDSKTLTEEEFVHSLKIIDSYLLRRAVIGLPNNSYWSIFARITHQLMRESPFQSLLFVFSTLSHNYVFPLNESFLQELSTSDLYYRPTLCKTLLDRLENDGQLEPSPTSEYSIEHIMPQTLTNEWNNMLGNGAKQIHEEWLHRLGNLTLTAYNPQISNSPFSVKKTTSGGFNDSSVRLNKYVREQTEWTLCQMEKRGSLLANQALEIWQYPNPDKEFAKKYKIWQLRGQESQKNVEDLVLNAELKKMLVTLDQVVRRIDEGIIGPIEGNSVCYYNPGFFMEVLPAADRLRLLLNIGIENLDDLNGIARDVTSWNYIRNATNSHPYYTEVELYKNDDLELVVPLIHQAYVKAVD